MTENKQVSKTEEKVSLVCSYRLFLALLAFSGVFLCYAQRREEFLEINFSNESERVNGTAIISFALGYVLTHVPSAIAVNLIGPQRFFALIIFLSSIFTGLLPFFRQAHVTMLLCFSIGVSQGGLWPTIFRFWSTWAPASERTTLLSFQIAGPSTSVIVMLLIFNRLNKFSLLDNIPFIHRYGWIYYCIFGCLGIIWSIIWLIFASDTPATNKYISAKEKEYIRVCKIDEGIQDLHKKTPWRSIFQSLDFWCTTVTMIFREIGVYGLWIVVPRYMKEVLLFDISKNDRLYGLLHIAVFICIIFTGISADFLIRNKYLKHVNTRKIFQSIGALGTTICLSLVLFLDYKHVNLSVCLYIIGLVLNDCMKSGGYFVHILDFSGIHSSVVLALGEALSTLGTLCAFRLTNIIVKHETAAEWRMASIISTASFILSAFIFLVFASGKLASWARREQIHNEELMEIDSL